MSAREDRGQSPLDPLSTQHVLLKELLAPAADR